MHAWLREHLTVVHYSAAASRTAAPAVGEGPETRFWRMKRETWLNYSGVWGSLHTLNPLDLLPLFIALSQLSPSSPFMTPANNRKFCYSLFLPSPHLESLQRDIKYPCFLTDWLRLQGAERRARTPDALLWDRLLVLEWQQHICFTALLLLCKATTSCRSDTGESLGACGKI